MSELTTMSVTVAVAPHVRGTLTALVAKHLPARPVKRPRDRVENSLESQVVGTVIQISNLHGDLNNYDNR
ncbi:hypothetical protein [Lentzea sp. NBRC 102530]|uniref:hypothetical protein n=1 Tax=Lentzea sp. NBRC 102530 TaxID=3032201 RepID=UPI0024A128FA|nr:hypothetical protein [Lentzea sp. NBRC 102530]GLY48889.1 hypothetical protein Lesp01_25450 [Lentzea sp. NBRC 102530]